MARNTKNTRRSLYRLNMRNTNEVVREQSSFLDFIIVVMACLATFILLVVNA